MGPAKEELLARVIADAGASGLRDRSLRELAAATGTSHRMLLYHFGSREGLVEAVVEHVEAAQRRALLELAAEVDDPGELVRRVWARVSSPELLPYARLFFESVSFPRGGSMTRPWLADAEPASAAVGVPFDPVAVRLGIAVVRGLLVDVLAGDDRDQATAALERFVSMWELERSTVGPGPAREAERRRGASGAPRVFAPTRPPEADT